MDGERTLEAAGEEANFESADNGPGSEFRPVRWGVGDGCCQAELLGDRIRMAAFDEWVPGERDGGLILTRQDALAWHLDLARVRRPSR